MAFIYLPKRPDKRVQTTRVKEYQEIYNTTQWVKIRALKFRLNPICEDCERAGRTTPTAEVHHIIKFIEGLTKKEVAILAYRLKNLVSLCVKCHKKRHENYKTDKTLRFKLLGY